MKSSKKIIILFILIVMFLLSSITVNSATYRVGDVNRDNSIDVSDVTDMQFYIARSAVIIDTAYADFNGDSIIDIDDCTQIQTYLAGATNVYGGYIYTLDGNKATIIGYHGSDRELKIPSYAYGFNHSFVSIGNNAFRGKDNITSVTIPKSIESIGYYAFSDCTSLSKVTVKNVNCHIDSSSFNNCPISEFKVG